MGKEIEAYQAHTQTGILLNANESPYNVSEKVMEEMVDVLPTIEMNRYPDDECTELRQAYAQVKGLKPEQIIAGNGSDQCLSLVMSTYLDHEKTMYTLSPDFGMFDYYASSYEANIEKYVTNEDGSFDVDDFIQQGNEKGVDLVLFSNPNNPTGHCVSREDILKIVQGFSCPVLIDEAYMEFGNQSVLDQIEQYDNLLVTRTLSKAFGLAGLRVGFVCGNAKRIAQLNQRKVPYAVNTISQKLATIVLKHYEDISIVIQQTTSFRDEMLDKLMLYRFVEFYPSQANFIYGKAENKELLLKLFKEADITIRDFAGTDHFRISIGDKQENEAVLNVMSQYVREML